VVLSTKHSTTNEYHHNRIKDDMGRIVIHSRVSINFYNVNAQDNYNLMTIIKSKTLMERYAPVLAFA
jgi:hypothetical protein